MKLCRFQPLVFDTADVRAAGGDVHPAPLHGVVTGESVREIIGSIFGGWSAGPRTWPLVGVKLLPPVTPTKIVCLGRNYREHAAELGNEPPKEPLIFLKPPSAIIAPEEPIVLPTISKRVEIGRAHV